MATFFPCPNPACTYQFDADQLPAAAMVTCPICRTRFPYRAAAQAPAPPSHDAGEGEPWGQNSGGETPPREKVNRLVNPRNIPTGNKYQTALMLIGFSLVMITLMAILVSSSKKSWFDKDEEPGTTYTDENFNFRLLRFDKSKWREDTDLRGKFDMNAFLYKRQDKPGADPNGWIGLKCIYLGGGKGTRAPREGELDNELKKILKNFTAIQRDQFSAKVGKISVAGSKFTGNYDETEIYGEAYAFHNKGIGYFMLMWAPRDKWDGALKDLAEVRDSFEFASQRDNWKDTSSGKPFYVPNGDYEIIDNSGLWRQAIAEDDPAPHKRDDYIRNATDEDESATMLFRCMNPDHEKKARKDYPADAMVLVLPPGSDTVDAVKKHVHASLVKKEGDRKIEFTFEPYQKLPFDFTIPSSEATIGSFKMTVSLDRTKKFYGISVKKINDHAIAVVGWCKEVDSDTYGPLILNLAASLKERHR